MNKTKDDWEELIRSDFLLYNVCVPFHSIKYSNEFLGNPKYQKLMLYIKGNIGRYYENFKDHFIIGDYCLELFLKDPKILDKFLKSWKSVFEKLDKSLLKIHNTNLKETPTNQLIRMLEKLYKDAIYWHGVAYNVDSIDATLNPKLQKLIEDNFKGQKKSKISEIYNKLTFPDILSYVNRMAIDKLALMIKIKKQGIDKTKQDIKKFIDDYYWINFQWGESEEYTEEELLADVKNHRISDIENELNETKKRIKKSHDEKAKLVADISKSCPTIQDYIRIFDEYAVLHDLRKEGQVKSVYFIRKIYKEISKRIGVKVEDLYYLWPMELVNNLSDNNPVNMELINKRKKGWFCIYTADGKSEEYFGKDADEQRNQALGISFHSDQKELSGMGASQGRVIGNAKVALSVEDAMEKIEPGDILITGMTMPEFVPAMKKAAGIVTDEGGLTCHAAIISRELSIPCVVGTKMATRIIKDGDKVEVNANHGVVKILK